MPKKGAKAGASSGGGESAAADAMIENLVVSKHASDQERLLGTQKIGMRDVKLARESSPRQRDGDGDAS